MMLLTDESQAMYDTLVDWVGRRDPVDGIRRRADLDQGYDPQLWSRACQELGLAGITVAEELGGAAMDAVVLAAICEASGRELALEPLLPTVGMALSAVQLADPNHMTWEVIQQIVGGTRAALVMGVPAGPFALSGSAQAELMGSGARLHGHVPQVVGAGEAELLIVLARTAEGPRLVSVAKPAPGVTTTQLRSLDLARPVASVHLDGALGTDLGPMTDADLAVLQASIGVFFLAELLGSMTTGVERAVDYAKKRVQFGRPIGSFQAVKHRCVDMLVDLEKARSQLWDARAKLPGGGEPLRIAASSARIVVGEASERIARSSLHIHGGLGFTWEDDSHLHLRRAKSTQLLLGPVDDHLEFLAHHIGLREPQRRDTHE